MTRYTEPAASPWRTPLIIGGVLVLAVAAGLLLAFALNRGPETASPPTSPTPIISPNPDDSPAASPDPSQAPSQAPAPPSEQPGGPAPVVEAPEGVLPPGSVARVVVDALRIREGPTTDAAEVGSLSRDDLVVLGYSYLFPGFGPVDADGFTWYPLSKLGLTELPQPGSGILESEVGGWAAIADGTDVYVALEAPRCVEGDPDLALLQSLTEWERLACYGNRSITIEGVLGCGGCGGLYPGTYEPEWLASPMNYDLLSVEPQDRIGPFILYWSPDGPERPEAASILRVTGHFDEAAAAGCTVAPGEPEPIELEAPIGELYCRSHFVVEGYEVLGTDEDFPFG